METRDRVWLVFVAVLAIVSAYQCGLPAVTWPVAP